MRQETNDWSGKFTTPRGGRPAKLNQKFLDAFQSLVYKKDKRTGDAIVTARILLEDYELVEFINGTLDPSDQIHYVTFLKWKADAKRFREWDDPDLPNKELIDDVTFARFYYLYRMSLLAYKMCLLEKIAENYDPSWRGVAWLLERKFKEWNISDDVENPDTKRVIKRFIFEESKTWAIS